MIRTRSILHHHCHLDSYIHLWHQVVNWGPADEVPLSMVFETGNSSQFKGQHPEVLIPPDISNPLVGMHLDQSPPKSTPDVLLWPDTGCNPATSLDQSEASILSADHFRPMALHPAPLAIWLSNVMWAIRHFMPGIPFYRHFILQNFAARGLFLCFLSSEIECDQAAYLEPLLDRIFKPAFELDQSHLFNCR